MKPKYKLGDVVAHQKGLGIINQIVLNEHGLLYSVAGVDVLETDITATYREVKLRKKSGRTKKKRAVIFIPSGDGGAGGAS